MPHPRPPGLNGIPRRPSGSGVGGNNSLHSIDILVNKVIPIKPDIVVMMHNINDLVTLIYDQTYWGKNPTRKPITNFYFHKNLTGIKALSTLARDMYISNLWWSGDGLD